MRAKAFNSQIFLELLCYCFFAGVMLYLVGSGKYLTYVTPRMKPYFYFTAIVMLLWACAGLLRLFRPQHRVRSAHCFVLAIPVLLLLLPHNPLGTSDLSGSYMGGNTFFGQAGQYGAPQKPVPPGSPGTNAATSDPAGASGLIENNLPVENPAPTDSDTPAGMPDEGDSAGLPGLDAANKKITVSNDDFGMWISEIYVNMEKYEGYTVTMTGFVFKDSEMLQDNEFVPARLMMSCCVADLAPVGLLCRYDKVFELQKDSWITVEGTLFIGEYEVDGQKYDDPQIEVTKLTPAEVVEGYVYPY